MKISRYAAVLFVLFVLLTSCAEAQYESGTTNEEDSRDPTPTPTTTMSSPTSTTETVPTVQKRVGQETEFQAGVAHVRYGNKWSMDEYKGGIDDWLDYYISLSANSVSFGFPLYQESCYATEVTASREITPSLERVTYFIEAAKKRGFYVKIRPFIDEKTLSQECYYRGGIKPVIKGDEEIGTQMWFESYTAVLKPYLETAEELDVDAFVIGVELTSLEDETEHWQELLAMAREHYTGEIVYSINWDQTFEDLPDFLREVDTVGIDAFYKLESLSPQLPMDENAPQVIAQALQKELSRAEGIELEDVVISEVGVVPKIGAFRYPWMGPEDAQESSKTQSVYFQAVCDVYSDTLGIYFWRTGDFEFRGLESEQEVEACFKRLLE